MSDVAAALRTAAEVGEFFALPALGDRLDRRTLAELIRDPDTSLRRVARVRAGLASGTPDAVPMRAAASIDMQNLAARVVSPALGAAVLAGVVPELTPDTVWWADEHQRLATTASGGRPVASAGQVARAMSDVVLVPVVVPLVAAYAERYRLSSKILRGNLASALHGAVVVLDGSRLVQRVPAREVMTELLRTPLLAGTVRATAPRFVRNSCCLWYRVPGAALCGDCVLAGEN